MSTKRRVQKGRMDASIAAFRALADYDKLNCVGVLAETIARDEKDPELLHDLKVWANIDCFAAWIGEISKQGSPIQLRVGALSQHYDKSRPMTGEVWSSDTSRTEGLVAAMKGDFEYYELPATMGFVDLSKGDM